MIGSRANTERLLRAHPDGMTARQIAHELGITKERVGSALKRMPHVYIDHWIAARAWGGGIKWIAVYMLADLPESMPMPAWTPTARDLRGEKT